MSGIGEGARRLRIAVTGTTGFIGASVVARLRARGHVVVRLVRDRSRMRPGDVFWDLVAAPADSSGLEGLDAVVHLAGESLFGIWTEPKKERIRSTRKAGTRLLCSVLASLKKPPPLFLCASAVGIYGDRGNRELDENTPAGKGFLASVCKEWEAACEPALRAGIRVINLRLGNVLDTGGGMLAKLLPLYRWGLGARLGSGEQYVSWIALGDLLRALEGLLLSDLRGPVNLSAPKALPQKEFARELGRALHRPVWLRVPPEVLEKIPGGMGREMFLSGQRAAPAELLDMGFAFRHPDLPSALAFLLRR